MGDYDAEPILKNIKVPTLIFAADQDQFTPVWLSKKMHRLIPKSEILILKKATHVGLIEQPELLNLRIEKFLTDRLRKRI
jgi:pimeloyl-ACP methyl ester carboxylesterase